MNIKSTRKKPQDYFYFFNTIQKLKKILLYSVLIYSKTKVKVPLNKKTMHDLLAKYFNNDSQADNLVNYIMENREEKEKESIKRKINN